MLNESTQPALPHMEGPGKAAEPKRKERTRKRGVTRRQPPQPTLGFLLPGAEHNEDTGERFTPDCNGAPGICLFMRCRWNLILDVIPCVHCGGRGKFAGKDCHVCRGTDPEVKNPATGEPYRGESGGIEIQPPGRGKRKKLRIPLHRSNEHVVQKGDIERAGDMAADAAEWLEEKWGSTCAWDLIKQAEPMQLTDIGKVLRVSRERARQICEEGASRTRSTHTRDMEPRSASVEMRPNRAPVLVQIRRKERP